MSVKAIIKQVQKKADATLMEIKADANKLKTKTGAEAAALKEKIAKKSGEYIHEALYAPLAPLRVPMVLLLKNKGYNGYFTKSMKEIADKFYEVFVNPVSTVKKDFEEANFEYFVKYNLDIKGPTDTEDDATVKAKNEDALAESSKVAATAAGELKPDAPAAKKDATNSIGKSAGSLACTALMAVGIPVPPAVGAAVGSTVQGIIRGIISFFHKKKAEGNAEVVSALQQGGKDAGKIDVTTGEVKPDNKILYIVGGLAAILVIYFFVIKK